MGLPNDILHELGIGGKLHGLQIPLREDLDRAHKIFPQLANEYWTFIECAGIGDAIGSGTSVCLPYDLRQESHHPSLSIYRGNNIQALRAHFGGGKLQKLRSLPDNLAVVSRPGTSWFYCLKTSHDKRCYVYDLASQEVELAYEDFYEFIRYSFKK